MCLTLKQMFGSDKTAPVMLISGEAGFILSAFKSLGIQVIPTKRNLLLAAPVASHPDMQFFFFPDGVCFSLRGNDLPNAFMEIRVPICSTVKWPGKRYPGDVLCNAFYHAGAIYGRLDSLDHSIIEYARDTGIKLVTVKQGYAACSVCSVNDQAVITADAGLAKACGEHGMDVLKITAGHIRLPGYDYGFIGGCSGRIGHKTIAFTGSLKSHPDGKRIQDFIHHYDMDVLELSDGPLFDIGGMIDIGRWFKTRNDEF